MTKTVQPDPNHRPDDAGRRRRRKPYVRPIVNRLGTVSEVVRFPGGSLNAEGLSGKPHQQ